MAINITNRSKQLLILTLNNGEAIYLEPDGSSDPVDEALVDGNEKFSKLLRNNSISSVETDVTQARSKKPKADK